MCIEWTQPHATSYTSIGSHTLDALAISSFVERPLLVTFYWLTDQVIPQGIESQKARKSFNDPVTGAVYITKFMTINYYNGASNQLSSNSQFALRSHTAS